MGKTLDAIIYIITIIIESGLFAICFIYIKPSYVGVIVFIIINCIMFFLVRLFALYFIYPGQCAFIKCFYYSYQGTKMAKTLLKDLKAFKNELKAIIKQSSITTQKKQDGEDSHDYIINEWYIKLQFFIKILLLINKSFEQKHTKLYKRQIILMNDIKTVASFIDESKFDFIKEINKIKEKEIECSKHAIPHTILIDKDFIKQIKKLLNAFNLLKESLKDFTQDKWYQIIFLNILGSIELSDLKFEFKFKDKFNYEEYYLNLSYCSTINYVIIKSDKSEQDLRTIMLISGMNMTCYEDNSIYKYFTIYLNYGIDLLFWNYRGYGYSKGFCTFSRVKQDIITLYDTIVKMGQWDHYGTHGISIGGIASTHLAVNRRIDFLVSDKNVMSIDSYIKSWNCHPISLLYSISCIGKSDIVSNFIEAKCRKLVLCSQYDNMIDDYASLKTGVSLMLIKKHIRLKRFNKSDLSSTFIESASESDKKTIDQNIFQLEYYSISKEVNDILDVLLSNDSQMTLVTTMVELFHIHHEIRMSPENKRMKVHQYTIQSCFKDTLSNLKSYELLNDFVNSFDYGNTNLHWLSKEEAYIANRKKLGAFFSNLYIWSLNENRVGVAYWNRITTTLGYSLSKLNTLNNHFNEENSNMKNQVNNLMICFKKIVDQWKLLNVIASKDKREMKNVGMFIKLSSDHVEDMDDCELIMFDSEIATVSNELFARNITKSLHEEDIEIAVEL